MLAPDKFWLHSFGFSTIRQKKTFIDAEKIREVLRRAENKGYCYCSIVLFFFHKVFWRFKLFPPTKKMPFVLNVTKSFKFII